MKSCFSVLQTSITIGALALVIGATLVTFPLQVSAAGISEGDLTAANGWTCNSTKSNCTNKDPNKGTASCTYTIEGRSDNRVATCTVTFENGTKETTTTSTGALGGQERSGGTVTQPSGSIGDAVFGSETADFVPLTNLPGIKDASNATSLPNFLNQLYKLCIGAAAVIAVLQIMRAGMYFMFNKGSVAQNEQGKSLIQNSILGLLLVLSPAIVFGIINPDILKLKIDFSKIQPERPAVQNSDLSTINQLQCSAYVNPVEYCDHGSTANLTTQCNPDAKCPAGQVKTTASCCSIVHGGSVCCAQIPNELYAIAYTYLRKNNDGTTCRVSYKHYYAKLVTGAVSDPSGAAPSGCDAAMTEEFIKKQNGVVSGSLQMLKSCEKTGTTAYEFPANLRNTCGVDPSRDALSPLTVYANANATASGFNVSSVWRDTQHTSGVLMYKNFVEACSAAKKTTAATVSPSLTLCPSQAKGAQPGCRTATVSCK